MKDIRKISELLRCRSYNMAFNYDLKSHFLLHIFIISLVSYYTLLLPMTSDLFIKVYSSYLYIITNENLYLNVLVNINIHK